MLGGQEEPIRGVCETSEPFSLFMTSSMTFARFYGRTVRV